MDGFLDERVPDPDDPDRERVESRAKSLRKEHPEADDPEASAEELLRESDARTEADPAPRDLDEDRVERRDAEDTTSGPPKE